MRVLLIFLCLPVMLFSQPYQIGEITVNIQDVSRSNRVVETKVFYPASQGGANQPAAPGSFPLVVLGHGFAMNFSAYQNFWEELVPRGYILALPTTESALIPFPSHGDFGLDLSLIVDHIRQESTNPNSAFYNKVTDKAAIMGHSMGGGATFLAAGASSNVTTIIGFAPAETNPSAIAASANINVPALVFIGSLDNVAPEDQHATPMYNGLNSSCKTYITITDGAHCRFANSNFQCEFGETSVCAFCSFISRPDQQAITFQFLNPWLAFFLKEDCAQLAIFQSLLTTSSAISYQQSCNIQQPEAEITVSGDTTFCPGGNVILSTDNDLQNIWSTGDTGQSINISEAGSYFLVVKDQWNCIDTSRVVPVVVFDTSKPILINVNDTLRIELSDGETVEWFLDDSLLTGLSGEIVIPFADGNYAALVTDTNGCISESNTVSVTLPVTGIRNLESEKLFVYPNPTKGTVTFSLNENIDFRLFNYSGQLVAEGKADKEYTHDFSGLINGLYLLQIRNENNTRILKLMILP